MTASYLHRMKRKMISLRLTIHLLKWYFVHEVVGEHTPNIREHHFLCFSWYKVTTDERLVTPFSRIRYGTRATLLEISPEDPCKKNMEELGIVNHMINSRVGMTYIGEGEWTIDGDVSSSFTPAFDYKIRLIDWSEPKQLRIDETKI